MGVQGRLGEASVRKRGHGSQEDITNGGMAWRSVMGDQGEEGISPLSLAHLPILAEPREGQKQHQAQPGPVDGRQE